MSRKPTLNYVLKALRRGETPHTLNATYLGAGIERRAYRLGDWVIKSRSSIFSPAERRRAKQALRRAKLTPVPTRYAAGYMVQPYVESFNWTKEAKEQLSAAEIRAGNDADIHYQNVGHFRGQLVAFDW